MNKVFIDGSAGTTGLRIYERLVEREDIHILTLPEKMRKDRMQGRDVNTADVVFLCLPDDAAIEAVSFMKTRKLLFWIRQLPIGQRRGGRMVCLN